MNNNHNLQTQSPWNPVRLTLVWTVGVAVLTTTSDQLPPNPRMLLCAFPLLIVLAAQIEGRAWRRMIYLTSAALIVLSPLTFIAKVLRP
jgi:hypothetical protein